MYQLVLLVHVFIAIFIVAMVLVQQGKGATLGAAFGAGASQTIFGSRGSGSFLFRMTITFAILFFATSIGLNYMVMSAYKKNNHTQMPLSMPAIPATAPQPTKQPAPVESITNTIPSKQNNNGASANAPKNDQTETKGTTLPNKIPVRH